MSSNGGVKRKNGGEEVTGREKKKQRMNIARTIPVQSGPVARDSSQGVVNGMRGLPSAIDVEKFAEARAFEIDAMESAMKTASNASTQRAWQALPRHLRRRAASHDVRRVPARLREKARAEMDPMRKKLLSRKLPKAGKNKKITRTASFLKRQHDKSWLETHLWHAKRMKMENMWGYRLAVQPTEKSYRPSHRASIQGSILHDASYFATLEMKGPQSTLVSVLELICDTQGPGPGAIRWVVGSRVLNTHLYECGSYPFGPIGPVTIIWRPVNTYPGGQEWTNPNSSRKGKETATGPASTTPGTDPNRPRSLWLRIHPLIFDSVARELQKATSQVLDRPRPSTDEVEVEIADLRGQVNAFEIMGPKSSQVLKGALSPVSKDDRQEFKKFWSSLSDVQVAGSIPRGTVVGFTVIDPRLNFPPKNASVEYKEEAPQIFPSTELAKSDIWEQDIRNTLFKPRYKKKDLDERRHKNLVPGTSLSPTRQDSRVPLLLIRRTLETPGVESQSIHGYVLLIPAGWSMAFWPSLIYTGTRVGGQRERQTQAFEAGTLYFPRDFPFSPAYESWVKRRESEERGKWVRTPPAKRVNYGKLGVRSPWRADWDVVLGLKEAVPFVESMAEGKGGEKGKIDELVSTQRDDQMDIDGDSKEGQDADIEMEMDVDDTELKPWLFHGPEITRILAALRLDPATNLLKEINKLRQKRSLEPLGAMVNATDLLNHALVNVKVTMFKEGVPEDMAMIYRVSDEEAASWEKLMEGGGKPGERSVVNILQLANRQPPQGDVIGYVTTGHYSLSRGEGFALGAVPLTKLLELQRQQGRLHPHLADDRQTLLVKVRNINGQQCRPAHIKVLECGS
ncbi:POP1-domain-containing protein [Macrolepiota fuliginosa MF-IS2]|uniref:POP1-domain-containing protein n=1 Tax=Macrolepiota fuliginosa MF-IS2 TaxID=1400762 RepID=A0A9P5XPT5_9AGAR|nr:POP1-domain-containing protein [Macrolepiota fuliginosa MF-IS2]